MRTPLLANTPLAYSRARNQFTQNTVLVSMALSLIMVLICRSTHIATLYQVDSKSLGLASNFNHQNHQKNGSFYDRSAADQHETLMHYIKKIRFFLQSQTDHSHRPSFEFRDSNSNRISSWPDSVHRSTAIESELQKVSRSSKPQREIKAKERPAPETQILSSEAQNGDSSWLRLARRRQRSLEAQLAAVDAEEANVSSRQKLLAEHLRRLKKAEDAVRDDATQELLPQDTLDREDHHLPEDGFDAAATTRQEGGSDAVQVEVQKQNGGERDDGSALADVLPSRHGDSDNATSAAQRPAARQTSHKARKLHATRRSDAAWQPPPAAAGVASPRRLHPQILAGAGAGAQYVKVCKTPGSGDCSIGYRPASARYKHVETADSPAPPTALNRRTPFGPPPSSKGVKGGLRTKPGGPDGGPGGAGEGPGDAEQAGNESVAWEAPPATSERYVLPDRIMPKQVRAARGAGHLAGSRWGGPGLDKQKP